MLAPLELSNNTASDRSNEVSSSTRSPQEANYQIDDNTRPSAHYASSPQEIEGYSVPSTHTMDSPLVAPSVTRHPQASSVENSPSLSHPQAYSPALSTSYIPPPSPSPSQRIAYPVPNEHIANDANGTIQQYSYIYQDPYQQTYQQPYPEPTSLYPYPEPALVDTYEKQEHTSSLNKPINNGRRKKIIWVGGIVILILIGAIIGLVVSMKNKDSNDKDSRDLSNNNISGTVITPTKTTPAPTTTGPIIPSIPVTLPSIPITTSSIPVTLPPPTPTNPNRVIPPPLPSLPPSGSCPTYLCSDYHSNCRDNVCSQDGDYKACIDASPVDTHIDDAMISSSSEAPTASQRTVK
ncbi:hypothetical protein FBU30_002908 [Linnemannia zychae]|nr:hypothetical protein FBU30_002908 [Linnemannia zychae]